MSNVNVTGASAWSVDLARAVRTAAPAVLQVARRRLGGSATVWDAAAGLVVTAHHTAGGEDTVRLTLPDGEERDAEVVGRDPGTDLALLRTAPDRLSGIDRADGEELEVGHLALALGRPGRSVRASLRMIGVVGPEVRTPLGGRLERWIETDRRLPAGFSGGPLVDPDGRLIGIDTSGLVRGADLTIPLATVTRVVEELLAHGAVRRGYLGVAVQRARVPAQVAGSLGQTTGALVVRVDEDSPAARAGLVLGDLIVALDGGAVTGADRLRELLAERRGEELEVRIVRVGALESLRAQVGEA